MDWTPYPELNRLLLRLLQGSQAALGESLRGMYLHGSLAAGGFDLQRSDVDFVVTTCHEVTPRELTHLRRLAAELIAVPAWGRKLEGAYMPESAFAQPVEAHSGYPCFDCGQWQDADDKEIDNALQRCTLREHGIVIAGPDPRTFIEPVSAEELRHESLRLLHEWWKPQIEDQRKIQSREYQVYAILTMCRILYTLDTGTVATKLRAARYMQQQHPQWHTLVERALANGTHISAEDTAETAALIQFAVDSAPALAR